MEEGNRVRSIRIGRVGDEGRGGILSLDLSLPLDDPFVLDADDGSRGRIGCETVGKWVEDGRIAYDHPMQEERLGLYLTRVRERRALYGGDGEVHTLYGVPPVRK